MAGSVLSVRVPDEVKEELDLLAAATRRSKSFLAQEAITDYVRRNAWKAKALQEAVAEADKGKFISQEAMAAWADSLGGDKPLPPPEPDIVPTRRR
ncbi:MAG: CopG family ribbon-helix-helix protein [Parvibaculaceae bacterium]|jgi:predicted transcriptional regulator